MAEKQLFDPQRIALINQQLRAQATATGLQPGHQALLRIQADGAHLQADRFNQELFALLTDPALVAAVKDVSGLDAVQQLLEQHGAPMQALPAMQPEDVDIHKGQVWHYGPANATPHWRRALSVAYVADGTRLCSHPPGFSGAAGATVRATTLRTLFGSDAEGKTVRGSRHPRH
ncbi:putative phytanoyl-CoA dioxygenase [Synechococcus sp. MEDNS5]|uniref:hypothetical protein n=1 Tax=Synechococcus sp. MEDNS5 TaxID=1442554 RepID=UPI0018603B81|nr:hypothetical protein [Synechococcus sp. MEDNS5]QNJ07303.1 putative phytanoyl-CoA dioxygenase [Synechococcus sp. MEDNS5]